MASPLSSFPKRALMALVRGYRLAVSPWLGSSCRFEPSCSAYALEALQRHGATAGTCLSAYRILRCNPLCAAGHDPVPDRLPSLFRHFSTGNSDAAGPSSPSSKPEPNP